MSEHPGRVEYGVPVLGYGRSTYDNVSTEYLDWKRARRTDLGVSIK